MWFFTLLNINFSLSVGFTQPKIKTVDDKLSSTANRYLIIPHILRTVSSACYKALKQSNLNDRLIEYICLRMDCNKLTQLCNIK